jgi:hypothetical protein
VLSEMTVEETVQLMNDLAATNSKSEDGNPRVGDMSRVS